MKIFLYVMFLVNDVWWIDPNFPPVIMQDAKQCRAMENYFGINMGIIQEHEYKIGCIQANDIWGFLVDTYGSRPYKDTQI
jgi:hypothetical protein|tara:strand:- start:216 stop:455 length:240 start_codon:yes stop_codon:yes gene_type:complete